MTSAPKVWARGCTPEGNWTAILYSPLYWFFNKLAEILTGKTLQNTSLLVRLLASWATGSRICSCSDWLWDSLPIKRGVPLASFVKIIFVVSRLWCMRCWVLNISQLSWKRLKVWDSESRGRGEHGWYSRRCYRTDSKRTEGIEDYSNDNQKFKK